LKLAIVRYRTLIRPPKPEKVQDFRGPRVIKRRALPGLLLLAAMAISACHRRDPGAAREIALSIQGDLRHDRLSQALDRSRKAARTWHNYTKSDTFIEFRLLESEALLATGQSSEAMSILTSLNLVGSKLAPRCQIDLGRALLQVGRKADALAAVDRGIIQAESSNLDGLRLEALVLKGWLLFAQDRNEEALEIYRVALAESDRVSDSYQSGKIFNNLGSYYLKHGRYDQAIPYYERARASFEKAQAPRLGSVPLGNLAICYNQLGNFDRAMQVQMQVIAVQERFGANLDLVYSYGEAGRLYLAQGDRQKAVDYYQRAFDQATQLKARSRTAILAVNLSDAYVQSGDWASAASFNNQALALNRSENSDVDLYAKLNAGGIAIGLGQIEQGRKNFEEVVALSGTNSSIRWGAYDELGKIAAARDPALSSRYFEKAIALIAETRSGLSDKQDQITFLSQPIGVYQDYVQSLIDRGDSDKALLTTDSSRARILMESGTALPPTVQDLVRTARKARAVIVSYWLTPSHSFVWIISEAGARFIELHATDARIHELVTAYREELEHSARNPIENLQSAGWKLSEIVLKPIQPWVPDRARVIVIPDGPLHDINFETLPIDETNPRYWIEQATLSIAPSLRGLAQAGQPDKRRPGGVLIVGDPVPEGIYTKLAYAQTEMQAISRRFATREKVPLAGPDATVEGYRKAHPERFSLIHFTAHAEANRESPLDSAIILSRDGEEYKLYARDIPPGLRAELVTVSACKSAGAKAFQGEGLIGFAWAFLHAGAHHVIAGLWDVNDRSTAQLMDRLYAGLEAGKTPPQALREAKLELLRSPGVFKKPYYWGPLQVYTQTAN
jgi:CHAT domain-containing protein